MATILPPPPQQQHRNLIGQTIDGRLELVAVLGLGAYGIVYLARDKTHYLHQTPLASTSSDDRSQILAHAASLTSAHGSTATGYYAVKCLNKVGLDSRQRRFQRREIALHTMTSSHPSVCTLHRVIDREGDDCIYVVLDYCPDGDLFSMITERGRYMVDQRDEHGGCYEDEMISDESDVEEDCSAYEAHYRRARQLADRPSRARVDMDALIKNVFDQILDAVEFCHSYGIYHRDLKPENILCLAGGTRVAVTDFGLATGEKRSSDFGCGSTFYMGPECQGGIVKRLLDYSPEANDVWSLGVILVNLICGRNPWKQACVADETFQEYLRNPDFLKEILPISDATNTVLKTVFTVKPENRTSVSALRKAVAAIPRFTASRNELRQRHQAAKAAAAAAAAATARIEQGAVQEKRRALLPSVSDAVTTVQVEPFTAVRVRESDQHVESVTASVQTYVAASIRAVDQYEPDGYFDMDPADFNVAALKSSSEEYDSPPSPSSTHVDWAHHPITSDAPSTPNARPPLAASESSPSLRSYESTSSTTSEPELTTDSGSSSRSGSDESRRSSTSSTGLPPTPEFQPRAHPARILFESKTGRAEYDTMDAGFGGLALGPASPTVHDEDVPLAMLNEPSSPGPLQLDLHSQCDALDQRSAQWNRARADEGAALFASSLARWASRPTNVQTTSTPHVRDQSTPNASPFSTVGRRGSDCSVFSLSAWDGDIWAGLAHAAPVLENQYATPLTPTSLAEIFPLGNNPPGNASPSSERKPRRARQPTSPYAPPARNRVTAAAS